MFKRIIMILYFLSSFLIIFFFGIYPFIKNDKIISVPDVVSLTENEARKVLDEKKIKYEIVYVEGNINQIQKTVPEANSLIKQAQTITIYVERKGDEIIKDLIDMSFSDAKQVLDNYKKKYNIEYEVLYRTVDDGIDDVVLEQSVYEKRLEDIKKIIITVSKCEYYSIMPNFVGLSYKEAFKYCKENGLIFEGIYINSILDEGTIIYQEIESGEKMRKNSKKKLLFYIAK